MSQAPVGMAQTGLDGALLLVNERYGQMLGYSEAELRRKTLQDLTHPDDWDATLRGRDQLLAGEISLHTMEKRYIRKDGTIYWGRLNRSLMRDRDGVPRCIIAVVEDITEKIQAESALRDSEQRLMLAQSAAHVGVWDCDLRTNVTLISGEYARIHGLAPDHPPLKHEEWLGLVHPADRERVETLLTESIEKMHVWDHEFRVVWPDGSVHWLLGKGTIFRDAMGRPVRIAGVTIDITERKCAEAALRESEERLRFAQEVASIGTFDWNFETGVNMWTPELEALYDLPQGFFPATQLAWEDLIHPDDRAQAVQRVKESYETGAPVEGEWRIILRDGRVRWLFARWQVFKNAAGKPLRMMGVNMDVTNRKSMEEALRQSEERFRLAVQATNDAVWDIDLATGTVSWNEMYTTLFGRPPETSKSWQWWIDRIHPEDRERTSEGLRSAISGSESTWTCEYRFQRVDGTWAYLYDRAYIARDPSGSAWRVIGAMQDLTQRKRVEAELRESEERFRNMADTAPVMIWVADSDANCTFTNRSWLIFTGRTLEQEMGHGWTTSIHPDDLDRCFAIFSSVVDARQNFQIEYRARRADGKYRCLLGNAVPRLGSDGSFEGYIGSCVDITDLKLAHEERLAEQKLETVGMLAGGIAHDFNNLLGGVLAYSDLVLAELASGSGPAEGVQNIRGAAIRGAEIVRQLMVYTGEETEELKLVSVSAIVQEMLELLKVSVSKHVTVKTDLGRQLPGVHAIPAQIRQIVMNLITNASEAIGDRDGVIRVTTSQVTVGGDSPLATSKRLAKGDYVQMEVSDTGRGMTPEVQARIFDPFFTTKGMGTHGLGLAAVRTIVDHLHGTIQLSSLPGTGTTVQIMLPGSEQNAATHSTIAGLGSETFSSRGATILVVEDEDLLRQGVAKMLRKNGLSVIEAGDGSAALDVIRAHSGDIDLLLLDITLPGASSREVYEQAKRLRPDLPVIVTSAKSKETAAASLAARIERFLRKPFSLGELVEMVREILLKSGEPRARLGQPEPSDG